MYLSSRVRGGVAGLALAGAAAGCQVDWAGGSIVLEDPSPPPDTTAVEEELEPQQIPLPDGPHLFAVTIGPAGVARAAPIARIDRTGDGLALEETVILEADDPTFRVRFDSVFLAPGRELDLLAYGERLGSLVLEGVTSPGSGVCPSVAGGRALLVPGQAAPRVAFAVPQGVAGPRSPVRASPPEETRSMGVAAPVLAERLIGGERAFLAQLQSMAPVALVGDTLAGMTATYLIADSLAVGPPGENAVSLFFLARFEPAQGFIPLWTEVRRYTDPADKEALEFLDWIRIGNRRLDFVRRYDASSVRVAASVIAGDEERSVDWTEPAGCESLSRLGAN